MTNPTTCALDRKILRKRRPKFHVAIQFTPIEFEALVKHRVDREIRKRNRNRDLSARLKAMEPKP